MKFESFIFASILKEVRTVKELTVDMHAPEIKFFCKKSAVGQIRLRAIHLTQADTAREWTVHTFDFTPNH